jgi:hypothetical protein
MGAGGSGGESPTFLVVMAALALSILIVGAVLIYRDVERHGGDGVQAALARVVFWPLGVNLWRRSRRSGRR